VVAFNGEVNLGTAAAPSVFFTGDTNTGIYSPGADQVAISTNGQGRLFINASGNVGLGTSSPGSLLSLYAGASAEYFRGGGNGVTTRDLVLSASTGTNAGDTHTINASGSSGRLILSTASSPRMTVDSSGRVGIGTTSPSAPLHVTSSIAGGIGIGTTSPSAPLHVTSSIAGGIVNITSTSTSAALVFNDSGTGGNYPKIGSEGSNLVLRGGAVSNAAYIDASGRLLVGTSSTVGTDSIFQVRSTNPANLVELSREVNDPSPVRLNFVKNRGSATASVINNDIIGDIRFQASDGVDMASLVGRITCEVDGVTGADDTPGRLVFSTTADGASSPTEQLRITSDRYVRLASGTGGIQFNGDTAAANALDDYEEGTWTPVFIGTSTAGTPTYGTNGQAGKYTKVGNKVTAWAYIDVTALGGAAGNINITGLPFAISNIGFGVSGISVGHADGTLGNGVRAYHNTTFLELRNNNSVVTAATGQIYASITYTT
jgi:hypothetical protein